MVGCLDGRWGPAGSPGRAARRGGPDPGRCGSGPCPAGISRIAAISCVVVPGEVAEHDRDPELLGQRGEGGVDVEPVAHGVVDRRRGVGHGVRPWSGSSSGSRSAGRRAPAAELVEAGVGGHPVGPGRELRSAVEGADAAHDQQQGLLGRVGGVGVVAGEATAHGPDPLVVPTQEQRPSRRGRRPGRRPPAPRRSGCRQRCAERTEPPGSATADHGLLQLEDDLVAVAQVRDPDQDVPCLGIELDGRLAGAARPRLQRPVLPTPPMRRRSAPAPRGWSPTIRRSGEVSDQRCEPSRLLQAQHRGRRRPSGRRSSCGSRRLRASTPSPGRRRWRGRRRPRARCRLRPVPGRTGSPTATARTSTAPPEPWLRGVTRSTRSNRSRRASLPPMRTHARPKATATRLTSSAGTSHERSERANDGWRSTVVRSDATHGGQGLVVDGAGLQVGPQGRRRVVAVVGVGGERLHDDLVQPRRHRAQHGPRPLRRAVEAGGGDGEVVVAREGRAPAEHLVQHRAHGVDVGAGVDLAARDLLGRQVLRRPDHAADGGEVGQVVLAAGAGRLGDAEVGHLQLPARGQQHVGRLHVPVDDAGLVRDVERLADRRRDGDASAVGGTSGCRARRAGSARRPAP